jgi:hypothetical protein
MNNESNHPPRDPKPKISKWLQTAAARLLGGQGKKK